MSENPTGVTNVVLIDSNVFFAKRLAGALEKEGLRTTHATQGLYALSMLERNPVEAIVCATNLREMGAFEIPPLLQNDPNTVHIAVIALGDGGDQALMAAFRAGCADYVDRRLGPEQVAAHIHDFLRSRREGFQPTQMLKVEDTSLSGDLAHLDLPSIVQMLAQTRSTGALHINLNAVDGVIFFSNGDISHAECGEQIGDEAVIAMVRGCINADGGVYKFVRGDSVGTRTVLRSAEALMLDACREHDENDIAREVS